jgi:hypothetical protein
MEVRRRRVILGLCLQAGALLLGYAFEQVLYSIAWLAILVIAIPMLIAGGIVLLNSGGRLAVRLVLAVWPVILLVMLGVFDEMLLNY